MYQFRINRICGITETVALATPHRELQTGPRCWLASVMLARGAAAVLAPLTVVRDLECADFVAEVHGELAAGVPFGQAVSVVRQRWLADDDLSRWAVASSFTCFGSGAVTIAREWGPGNRSGR